MACTNDDRQNETLKVDNFTKIGELHNNFLTNIKDNIKPLTVNQNNEKKIDYINFYNLNYTSNEIMNVVNKSSLIKSLNGTKRFIKTTNLTDELFDIEKNDGSFNIFEIIQELKNQNTFGDFGSNFMNDFAINLKHNFNGNLSDSDYKQTVLLSIEKYNNHNYSSNSKEGVLIGQILSISIHSIEWWEQNPDAIENKLLPWVAADIGGAIAGGLGSVLSNWWNDEDVDWSDAAAWAVGGAVGASTGTWLATL